MKLFAINLCKLIEFKNMDKSTFNNLANKNYEEYSNENNVDFSINNKEFYYRIEFDFEKMYKPYIGGRVTILNYANGGYYGYRIYFGYINTNKKLKNVQFINRVRVDEYLNGIIIKSTTVKIPRSFIMSSIH